MAKNSANLHDKLRKEVLADPEMRAEYEAFRLQLALAEKLKHARNSKHITQDTVAKKLTTTKSVIARLEAAGGKGRHSPSLMTLVRYATAIGCRIEINVRPGK